MSALDAAPLPDLEAIQDDLNAVDVALAAIEDGTYGTCTVCGADVADDLLAEQPLRPVCDAHRDRTD